MVKKMLSFWFVKLQVHVTGHECATNDAQKQSTAAHNMHALQLTYCSC